MNIAGVLVHAYPGEQDTVRAALETMEGVEVHHETDDGRFVVTVEDSGDTLADDTILALNRVPGVVSAALAYHNFEPGAPNTSPNRGA